MTDDNTVTVVERYSASIHASNLRDEADRASSTDILKAMAWTTTQMGAVLIRLRAEYDAVEKPRPLSHDEMVRLALSMHSDAKDPKERIRDKQIKAKMEAAKWARNEKTMLLGKLKTLPTVIDGVTWMCEKRRLQNPKAVATVLVGYWLSQLCTVCHGLKSVVIADAPTLSGKNCFKCGGSGFALVPHGESGKNMLNYMDRAVDMAKSEAQARY